MPLGLASTDELGLVIEHQCAELLCGKAVYVMRLKVRRAERRRNDDEAFD